MATRFFQRNRTQSKPWYLQHGGTRFEADSALVAENFPTLRFRVDESRELAFLEGDLEFQTRCGIGTSVPVRIEFPRDYPENEPFVFDAAQRFKAPPHKDLKERHILNNGLCCLWLRPKSPWDATDPNALRDFLLQVIVFFDRQLIYDITEEWPGPAYGHGRDGYLEFIQEELGAEAYLFPSLLSVITKPGSVDRNAPCPCGSQKKYKYCHMNLVEKIQRRIGFQNLLSIFPKVTLASARQ